MWTWYDARWIGWSGSHERTSAKFRRPLPWRAPTIVNTRVPAFPGCGEAGGWAEWRLHSTFVRDGAVFMQMAAKRLPLSGARAHQFKRKFALADRPHAMMNAAGAQARLRNGKAGALLTDEIFHRHTHIAQHQLTMPLGR